MAALATSQITMTAAYRDAAAAVQRVAEDALTQLRAEFAEALGCSFVDIAAHPVASTAQLPVVRAQITDAEHPQTGPLLTVDVTIERVTADDDEDCSRAAVTVAVDVTTATRTAPASAVSAASIRTAPARSVRSVASIAPATDEVLRTALASTARQGLSAVLS